MLFIRRVEAGKNKKKNEKKTHYQLRLIFNLLYTYNPLLVEFYLKDGSVKEDDK